MTGEEKRVRIASVQVGKPRLIEAPGFRAAGVGEKPWRSGYGKQPVAGRVALTEVNLEGDGQADKRFHGGPSMAVLAYSAEHYPRWREELQMPELPFGAFAENLTIEGADEDTVCLGDVWELPGCALQICQPRKPCNNISKFWHRADLLQRVVDSGRFGWYLRVLRTGSLEAGQEIRLAARPHPDWTVARAMRARLGRSREPAEAAALAALPELGEDWRKHL